MTPAAAPLSALYLAMTLGLPGSTANQADRSAGAGVVRLVPKALPVVYLRALEIDLGSSDEDVLLALLRCQREPLAGRCDESNFASEVPVHRAKVGAFWLSRTEVTVEQYERCVGIGRCRAPNFQGGAARFRAPNYPVTQVSYEDASRYCTWVGARLPTEAEFERAARGSTRRTFPWGRSFNGNLANHGRLGVDPTDGSDGFLELAPVGSYPDGATPEGVLDLAGNVEEWTSDPFTPAYGLSPTPERAVRGGHFAAAAPWLRSAARAAKPSDAREPTLGFRCVWPVAPAARRDEIR